MLEREAKLVAPAGFQSPRFGGQGDGFLAEPQPTRRYTTTYWDTPDLRLARWGASLRYRDDEGWTVKQPADTRQTAGVLAREERTFDGKPRKVPEEAAALLRVYVRGAWLQPVAELRAVRQPVELRNAAGELRSTLRTFMPLLDEEWAGRLRDELKWLANLLGDVRDAEVLHARLDRRVARLPAGDAAAARRLLEGLLEQRDAARVRLLRGMEEPRYSRLLDDLVAAAQAPAALPEAAGLAAEAAPPLVAKAWRKLKKAVKRAGATPTDESLHRIRVRAKRARYAAEAAQPVVGRPARSFAKAASNLQDELGEQHDAVVAQAWLRDDTGSSRRAETLAADQLIAAERAAAQAAREQWWPAWKRLARKKRTGWL